jgi:hypothetical protein
MTDFWPHGTRSRSSFFILFIVKIKRIDVNGQDKKCSKPKAGARLIYDALGLKYQPYFRKKSAVPEEEFP